MNTNQLKKFAQGARLKLLEQVAAKLDYVLTHDTAELRGKNETVKKLNWSPDVIHVHGWLASLLPLYIKEYYKDDYDEDINSNNNGIISMPCGTGKTYTSYLISQLFNQIKLSEINSIMIPGSKASDIADKAKLMFSISEFSPNEK